MAGFAGGEQNWVRRLGNLRNVIRQEMIRRQLAPYAGRSVTVLDVGCGQGTQAIELARRGCAVAGIEPSSELRGICLDAARVAGVGVELLDGSIEHLDDVLGRRRFDLVCAHGVLMYVEDRSAAIGSLARRVLPGGRLSVTFRNGHALAMRPALRRDWRAAISAFDALEYVNELGVSARADTLEDVSADLERSGFAIAEWFGVRVFNAAVTPDEPPPRDEQALRDLLDAEEIAGRRDPYRRLASQLHVIARAI